MFFTNNVFSCLDFQCWDECTASTSINKSIVPSWALGVTSMVRDNSLVSATISWDSSRSPSDCLVTWEVSGGGLIGNLLTQSSNVELSLWPETRYRVQVTCKNKVSFQKRFFYITKYMTPVVGLIIFAQVSHSVIFIFSILFGFVNIGFFIP